MFVNTSWIRPAVCVVTIALTACATTTFTSTWKAPDAQPLDPQGHRVAAVYVSTDEASRRVAEDTLVRKLNERGAQGVAAYTLIPTEALRNMDVVKARLADAGVEGVLMMRVIDEKERTTVTYNSPDITMAPYYWHFTSYWGYGWGYPYTPTQVSTETILRVETLVYSLTRDALLWSGTSRTVNPDKVPELVAEIADGAAKQMAKQGLLPDTRRVAGAASSSTTR